MASDDRFSALSTDPRYRLPSSKHGRVAVDKRFDRMFREESDFNQRAKVDKYGRKIKKGSSGQAKHLQRLYQEADEDEIEEEDDVVERETEPRKGAKARRKIEVASASDDSDGADEDSEVRQELKRVEGRYDPARDGGFSSSSDESSSDEEEVEDDAELEDEDEVQSVQMGDVSSRLAIVNLDWDNIRATDILAVATSFVPSDGRIESVTIYPSEFGKERLEREELEGPPKEIFASGKRDTSTKLEDSTSTDSDSDSDEDDETIRKKLQSGDGGEEFDSAALRKYQLDRLKYFYAVLKLSSEEAAQAVYTNMDGREYLSTANFFDVRFIPDEVSFDNDKPREQATSLPPGYKPNEFVTEALTHSKVKLTWDADDTTRKEVQKRAFSRNDIDENDMRAYIGGDSSSEEEEAEEGPDGRLSKKEAERQKMRALLGLANDKRSKKGRDDGPVGDMQITFTSGLSGREGRDGIFENSPPRDETTRERYVRKEKERKAKRKEKARAKRNGEAPQSDAEQDGGEDVDSGSEIGNGLLPQQADSAGEDGKDPFDDPFFNDPEVQSKSKKEKLRKEDKLKKREAKRAQAEKEAADRKQLELLMDEGGEGGEQRIQHFDMKEIQKAEKRKGKKGGRKDKKRDRGRADAEEDDGHQVQDDGVETADPRFARLFESHDYAIDPTNPRFQKTEGMQRLLNEGRKRRRERIGDEDDEESGRRPIAEGKRSKKHKGEDAEPSDDTQKLLARVKARSKGTGSR